MNSSVLAFRLVDLTGDWLYKTTHLVCHVGSAWHNHFTEQDRITAKDPRPTAFSVPKRNKKLVV